MRKQDIKTGVVYASQGRSEFSSFSSPSPLVFLSTELHTGRSRRDRDADHPRFRKALAGDKPGKSYLGRLTGCVVVTRAWSSQDFTVERLLEATLEGAIAGTLPPGVQAEVLTTLGSVRGPYDEVLAEYQRQRDERTRQREEADEQSRERSRRGEIVADALKAHGITAFWRGHLELTLENAEKLAALLPDHKPQKD